MRPSNPFRFRTPKRNTDPYGAVVLNETASPTSLAVLRARQTNVWRLGALASFGAASLASLIIGIRLPDAMFVVFVAWFVAAAAYALVLGSLRTADLANWVQVSAYCLDITFLTAMYTVLHGAWWFSATIYVVIAVFAFTSLPRRYARWVAVYAMAAYLGVVILQYYGVAGDGTFLGVPSLRGNAQLSLIVGLFGGMSIALLTVVQDLFVRVMREGQERYRALVQTAPDVIVAADVRGRIASANNAAVRMAGLSRDRLIGRPLRSLMPKEASDKVMAHFRAASAGESREFDLQVERSGETTFYDCSCTPIRLESSVNGVLIIARDVTESRRQAEALLASEAQLRQAQKMEAIGQLAGGIAHDFNNVLSVILGYCQFLRRSFGGDDKRLGDLRAIESTAESAASLTRQLLAFGRKQVIRPRLLDVNDSLRDLEEMLRRTLGSNIDIVVKVPPTPLYVQADPTQIEQVVLNLALNARDAMPAGGTLTIETSEVMLDEAYRRTHSGVSPGVYVMMAVSDTGIGMDAATQARVFEPFFTTKPVGKGTGLGLSTVYGIVRQAGGHIWLYSEVGRGTTFKVYLPMSLTTAEAEALPAAVAGDLTGTETLLLVDDADGLRPLLVRALREYGYNVLEARNGLEALEISKTYRGTIDLLVTDLVMPGINGSALAEEMLGARPDTRVLFMSGYASKAVTAGGRLREGAAFIAKPFTPDLLAREIRATLDGYAARLSAHTPPFGTAIPDSVDRSDEYPLPSPTLI